jgi:hypothetical protein
VPIGPHTYSAEIAEALLEGWKAGKTMRLGRFIAVPTERGVRMYVAKEPVADPDGGWSFFAQSRADLKTAYYFAHGWNLNRCIDDVADESPY